MIFWHKSQFGFTRGVGREENLIKNIDWISRELHEGHPVSEVFFDYSKAFDVAPRGLALDKMNEAGMRFNTLGWTRSWMGLGECTIMKDGEKECHSNRRYQYVDVEGEKSDVAHIPSGFMQGSALGPVFYKFFTRPLEDVGRKIWEEDSYIMLCRRYKGCCKSRH